jgi:type IV secretory pathway VirB10-like protein
MPDCRVTPHRRGLSRNSARPFPAISAGRSCTQDTLNQCGQILVRRQLNVQPTLTIRPGFPVRVIVNRDLVSPDERVRPVRDC